jgi:hypothetical protein
LYLSCEENDEGERINCQCNDAQRRIDNGQIDCSVDMCPDDCEVCKFCLYNVLDCKSHSPSAPPSLPPTEIPSLSPFEISDCASYSNQWFLNIAETCPNGDFKDCRCIDAERRIANRQISCGVDSCPNNCPVCDYCLDDLLGCTSVTN